METKKLLKKIEASQSLKREIDLYRRLKQAEKRIADRLEVIKASLTAQGECQILANDRKLASVTLQSRVTADTQKMKDEGVFDRFSKESESLVLRLH